MEFFDSRYFQFSSLLLRCETSLEDSSNVSCRFIYSKIGHDLKHTVIPFVFRLFVSLMSTLLHCNRHQLSSRYVEETIRIISVKPLVHVLSIISTRRNIPLAKAFSSHLIGLRKSDVAQKYHLSSGIVLANKGTFLREGFFAWWRAGFMYLA